MQRRCDRQRDDGAESRGNGKRQRRADHESDRRPDSRQQQHLRQIDREHPAAGRAERFQRGDHVALAVEMALYRVGDADAADQQRGEPDQGEELREALDIALERRRGVGAGANLPAGVGQLRVGLRRPPPRRRGRCRRARAAGSASAPGCRAAAGRSRASASSLTITRGPKPMPPRACRARLRARR